jgi:hypothetical protein
MYDSLKLNGFAWGPLLLGEKGYCGVQLVWVKGRDMEK